MNSKINGKLTKRSIIKRMWLNALKTGRTQMSLSYLARRISLNPKAAVYFMNWMQRNTSVNFIMKGKSFIFEF